MSPLIIFIIVVHVIVLSILFFYLLRPKKVRGTLPESEQRTVVPEVTFKDRLKKGLSRSRTDIFSKIESIFSRGLSDETIGEIEETLYAADVGPSVAAKIIDELTKKMKSGETLHFKPFLYELLKEKMAPIQTKVDSKLYQKSEAGLQVIMIVGVNGAGKTTTIGKLATKLTNSGAKVVVGACDTFRAAAVDQLAVWCERANAKMVRAKEGANPSGVAYDALQLAINEKADYCILDTAGRLHTKENLMEELKKTKGVLAKLDATAPHHTLLVLDAITGQNALRQAEEFNRYLNLTGLIFTKCDGSSKAGSAVGIVEKLAVPIVYIGVGETVEDLNAFNLDDYLDALIN